ncbi:MAG: RIP metalloprotease RseP [Prevotellaceae bacterium]|nr:RIP metalloprotease RseP [Prevotellaceae bacterium]
MEEFIIKLLQFLISISLLVLLHEGGHFFFSKLFKVRVEKFYLFFDWKFHLFEFKPKNSETAYGIGWIPLGGYCKIAGMIDESFDTEQMQQPAQPWEYRSKPAWQRFLIIIGGVLVNFLLGLFIYSMVMFHWGESYVAVRDLSLGMEYNETAKSLGFRDGDLPIKADGKEFVKFDIDVYRAIADADMVTVLRNGKEENISMPKDMSLLTMLKEEPQFMRVTVPAVVDSIIPGTPAAKTAMRKGDIITAINGKEVTSWNQILDIFGRLADKMTVATTTRDSLACRKIMLSYVHGNDTTTLPLVLTPEMQIGVGRPSYAQYFKPTEIKYNLLESIPAGIRYGCNVLKGYVTDLKYVFSGEGVKSLGGFGTIGNMFPATWDWYTFWMMTALLSIILAFMNILPIPALDGGHAFFLLYEMITGRKPSDNFMVKAEYVGFILLILLLVVANLNDVLRWIGVM